MPVVENLNSRNKQNNRHVAPFSNSSPFTKTMYRPDLSFMPGFAAQVNLVLENRN